MSNISFVLLPDFSLENDQLNAENVGFFVLFYKIE